MAAPVIGTADKDKADKTGVVGETKAIADISESEKEFQKRATKSEMLPDADKKAVAPTAEAAQELQTANAMEAI